MAKIFVGLAIAVMLAAAVLGYLSKVNIDKLQGNLKETKQTLARTESTLRKTEGELKNTQKELADANSKIEMQTTEINGLKKDKDDLNTKLAEASKALEEKTLAFDTLSKKLEDAMKSVPGGNVEELAKKVEQTTADLTKAQAEVLEKTQLLESMTKSKAESEEKLAAASKEVARYKSNVSRNGMTGKILAVNPGWNFVVLSVGDKQGAAPGSMMIVTRGGEAIGKARITSVEPSTSIADLIAGSVRKGMTVQPGDAVVYEGQRNRPLTGGEPAGGAPGPGAVTAPVPGN